VTVLETATSPDRTTQLGRGWQSLEVIVVNDFAHINGGSAKVAIESAVGLRNRGHDVTFFAAVPPVAKELEQSGIRVVSTGQYDIKSDPRRLRAAMQGVWNGKASQAMQIILRDRDPDKTVVHIHGWNKALSSSVIRQAALRRFAVVITLHDYFYACPNGGFFNFPRNEICSLQAMSAACLRENCDRDSYSHKLWRTVRQIIQNEFGLGAEGIRHFICLSDLSENILRSYLPANAHIYHVPNPVEFQRQDSVSVRDNSQFMAVGRLSREKGFVLLAEAGALIGANATFVGDGPERAAIEKTYDRAIVTGWQQADKVRKYLQTARALVLPSLSYEVQPISILEAAALGGPAIVADTCAARDGVEDGVTGLLFRGGDAADLAEKMAQLQDNDLVARLGRRAYEKYWENPSTMERHLAALEDCYRAVLRSRTVQKPVGVQ